METLYATRTLGVVVVHRIQGSITRLPAVRDLAPQVDELLIVRNGCSEQEAATPVHVAGACVRSLCFASNRGTAAAWNAALQHACESGFSHLFLLDQDSEPDADAVATGLDVLTAEGAAALVQPAKADRLRLNPFPWNAVASGSLYSVRQLSLVGGFDERLFVDEVDHELFARLMFAGYKVAALKAPTIRHEVGTPRPVRLLGWKLMTSGHTVARRRLQGYSIGLLVRRYLRSAPATSARLFLRYALTAAKDVAGGESQSARALLWAMATGAATSDPPATAAKRACPYCGGPLLGCFEAVPDWRFSNGRAADVYRCGDCGALAAGHAPGDEEVASWYADYYTHEVEHPRRRSWSRFWPTPRRRREQEQLRRYFTSSTSTGRFLDVGTGAGARLVQFCADGWDVVGQDLDEKAGGLARDRGLPMHHCPVDELIGREEPFDLIGMTHVLEHAVDPARLLAACSALLNPGGQLCIISPNAHSLGRWLFGRWWFGLEQPRHLGIPTAASLDRLTGRLGLRGSGAVCMPSNGAVILGGSLARRLQGRLPAGPLHRLATFSTALLGQVMSRGAWLVDHRLGEEVVWVGHRNDS